MVNIISAARIFIKLFEQTGAAEKFF
jgi:hypothetical protein